MTLLPVSGQTQANTELADSCLSPILKPSTSHHFSSDIRDSAEVFLCKTRPRPLASQLKMGLMSVEIHSLEFYMSELLRKIWQDDEGQDIAEYAVMLAVILVVVIGTIKLIGTQANTVFSETASSLQ